MPNKKLNLEIGKRFGKWEIISDETIVKNNITHWKCLCDCGTEQYVPLNNLMNGSSTQCRKCATKEGGKKRRKGYELISGDYWSQIKSSAKRKNITFEVRIEQAWEKFREQEGKCSLTGEAIVLTGYPYDKEKTTARLSLVEPEIGYVHYNIIWIHRDIEKLKGNLSKYSLLKLCNMVSDHNKPIAEL